VATGFAIAIVEPTMNSIGGRNQILVRTPDGNFQGIDGTTQAPQRYDPETAPQASYGYDVIGIPGVPAGLLRLHEEFGSMPLDLLMEPAIRYAEEGFRILPGDAARQAGARDQLLEFQGSVNAYLKEDLSSYSPGDLLIQEDYGSTLRIIAAGGSDAFYDGVISEIIAADLQAHGSTVDEVALANYRAEDAKIVRGEYRGYELIGTDIPSAGAMTIHALQIMEHFDPQSMTEAEWFAIIGQSLGYALDELGSLGTDSASVRVTSTEWAGKRATLLATPKNPNNLDSPMPIPVDETNPPINHTTHFSIADTNGMFVSLTQTLGPTMGSKVVTPGLGFLYASTLGGYLSDCCYPGERARSNISPFMVVKDGEVILTLGAAGGARIPPAIVNVISRVIDFDMTLPQALLEPRVAPDRAGLERRYSPDFLSVETSPDIGWTDQEVLQMQELGINISEISRTGSFGRIHGIQYDPDTGTFIGGADPDWEGSARGPTGLDPN
jgi:gamma-glutamyltranspeptidase/glutathione hydrolase